MAAVLKRLQQQHDQLIEAIYHASVEPGKWQTVLAKLVELLDGISARLLFLDGTATAVRASHTVNVDPGYFRRYADYYMNVCPWRPELKHKPQGRLYSTFLDFTNDQNAFHRSEFYNDWARPQGIEHGIGGNVLATPDYTVQLLIQRSAKPGHFTREETVAVNRLLPHMRQALTLQQRLEEERHFRDSVNQARLKSYLPCIVLNTRLEIVHLDERVISSFAGLQELRIVNDKVVLRDAQLNGQLQRKLKECAAAAQGEWSHTGEGCVRLLAKGAPLELHLYPLHPAHDGVFKAGNHYVAVYINDPACHYPLNARLVRDGFGLSPAEMRLAEAICNGHSLDEFAAKNGTSLNTVRSQAKQIFAKTGVSRQVELPKCLMPYLVLR
jgi:DNA-binding CsgD family transcriptional regulator